jgi:glutathione peroxidase
MPNFAAMRYLPLIVFSSSLACAPGAQVRVGPVSFPVEGKQNPQPMTIHAFNATDIHGEQVDLARFKGRKVLVVNTASECGYTPQYAQLQELHDTYKDRGLVVLGFPSNDFGGQEPGTEQQIEAFCQKNYGVTFPMMAKVDIKGDRPHPVYRWLTTKELNGVMDAEVKWNFHKFIIDEEGRLAGSFGSAVSPLDEAIVNWVEGR